MIFLQDKVINFRQRVLEGREKREELMETMFEFNFRESIDCELSADIQKSLEIYLDEKFIQHLDSNIKR